MMLIGLNMTQNPPVDWKEVKKELKLYGATKIVQIVAEDMIEDWFLIDLQGLCKYLGIKEVPEIKGKNGEDKIKKLFRKKQKIYIKGNYVHKFIDKLNLKLICDTIAEELATLEQYLFY